jgi:hypothetical protein
MRRWDLLSGAAKLDLAMENLKRNQANAQEFWSDKTSVEFQSRYLEPLEAMVKRALQSIHHLSQVLTSAQQECDEGRE